MVKQKHEGGVFCPPPQGKIGLKCIWNEIFDNNFIVLLESTLKDKINAAYRLLITCLDPKLWRSEVLEIKWKNGKKSSKNQ